MKTKLKYKRRIRRITRCRKSISGTAERPRLTVKKSLRHIYAQIIDDTTGSTLVSASSLSPDIRDSLEGKTKTEAAEIVGLNIARLAKARNIEKVVFDRHGNLYHGRVRAIAEGARKGGLMF